MTHPRMIMVAGPPGSGKTTLFPLAKFDMDCFNADTRAAELNGGSSQHISKDLRTQVNLEFAKWIQERIVTCKSFALETTLRTTITFEQARLARQHEFRTIMYYVSAGSIEESVKRVMERAYRGGHSASEPLIREIYNNSTRNVLTALDFVNSGVEIVRLYDNSTRYGELRELMIVRRGRVTTVADDISPWLSELLKGTKYDISQTRAFR